MRRVPQRQTVSAICFALLMVTSVVATGVAIAGSEEDSTAEIRLQSADDVSIGSQVQQAADGGKTIQVLVQLNAKRSNAPVPTGVTTLSGMQRQAEVTQRSLRRFTKRTPGVETVNSFYLLNAQLIELDTSEVSPKQLARIDGVVRVFENSRIEAPAPVEADTDVDSTSSEETTYGLDQVNAPSVWEDFDTTGKGVKVGVVDTGIDPDNPAFSEYNESNWAAFAYDGDPIESEPFDDGGHGTHVAGTVLGDMLGGRHVGVAPDAELYAYNVFPEPGEGTTLAAIIAGLEAAVEDDVDVINISIGGGGFSAAYIDVVRRAEQLGTLIVSSSGNSGVDTTGTPANVYDLVSVGATDENRQVVDFSTGDIVDTRDDWSFVAPRDWPDVYKTPDVSAPGQGVFSAYPTDQGTAAELSGTSMASPHTAGVAALIKSRYEDRSPEDIKEVLEETATKPPTQDISSAVKNAAAQLNDTAALSKEDTRDVRYGYGIVDAYAAFTAAEASGTIEGTVRRDGEPVAGAKVMINNDGVRPIRTDENGTFSFEVPPGEYEVSTSRFGARGSETVTVTAGETTNVTLDVQDVLDVRLRNGQPGEIASGDAFNITVDVANLESLTVDLGTNATVNESNVTVALGGQQLSLGEPVTFDQPVTDTVTLTITTTAPAGEIITLDHTFAGPNEELTVTTGPTTVLSADARREPLSITEFDPPSEVFYNEPSSVFVTIENTGDFTERKTVYHRIEADNGNAYTLTSTVELAAGETVTHELGPYNWWVVGDPGTTIEHQVALGAPPTRLGGNPDDETEIKELVLTGGGTITGQVRDSDTADPISGATVVASGPENTTLRATTDGTGTYRLTGAEKPGEYQLTVTAPAYATISETVTVTESGDVFERNLTVPSAPVYEFELSAGTAYSLGFPGPVEGTLGDVLDESDIEEVLIYNTTTGEFEPASYDAPIEPLSAVVVVPSNDTTATIEFAGEPGSPRRTPVQRDVQEGWNFVAPSTFAEPTEGFVGSSDVVRVRGDYVEPVTSMAPTGGFQGIETTAQLGTDVAKPPTPYGGNVDTYGSESGLVSPFAGYFVFFDDSGKQSAAVSKGSTRVGANEALNISTTPLTGTVESSITGKPIAGAVVEVAGASYSATTGPDGEFRINHVPEDVPQRVTVSATDFEMTTTTIQPGDATIRLRDESYFDITSFDAPESVSASGNVTVEYEVTNRGAETRDTVVQVAMGPNIQQVRVDNRTNYVDSRRLTLAPGESTTVSIDRAIDVPVAPGPQQIGVFTDATGPEPDDVVSRNITIVDATLRQQALDSAREVRVSNVGADAGDRLYIVYQADGDLEISGSKLLEQPHAGDSVVVPLDDGGGLPGPQLVYVVTDAAAGDEFEPGETLPKSITAGPLDSALVLGATLRVQDQQYDGPTDTVTVRTAKLRDGIGDVTPVTVQLHPTDENGRIVTDEYLGVSEPLTGDNGPVTVELTEPIKETDELVAMFHVGTSTRPGADPPLFESVDGQFRPVTDRATVEIGAARQQSDTGTSGESRWTSSAGSTTTSDASDGSRAESGETTTSEPTTAGASGAGSAADSTSEEDESEPTADEDASATGTEDVTPTDANDADSVPGFGFALAALVSGLAIITFGVRRRKR